MSRPVVVDRISRGEKSSEHDQKERRWERESSEGYRQRAGSATDSSAGKISSV